MMKSSIMPKCAATAWIEKTRGREESLPVHLRRGRVVIDREVVMLSQTALASTTPGRAHHAGHNRCCRRISFLCSVDTMGRGEGTTRKTSRVGAAVGVGVARFKVGKPRRGDADGYDKRTTNSDVEELFREVMGSQWWPRTRPACP
jgi:hypothetical protein